LAGVGSNTSFRALPLACLAGLIVGLAVGLGIYYSGRAIRDLKAFFIVSTIVLFFIAAGQVWHEQCVMHAVSHAPEYTLYLL
jgi:high-affinity iron transporter